MRGVGGQGEVVRGQGEVAKLGGLRYQIVSVVNKQYFVRAFIPHFCKLYKYSNIHKNALPIPSLPNMYYRCTLDRCK